MTQAGPIGIVSYGVGNVRALAHVYERHGVDVIVADTEEAMRRAPRLILPGVGAFDSAMEKLEGSGLLPVLHELVMVEQRPVLGICVGLQMMLDSSEEGDRGGLGWIPGVVRRFGPPAETPPLLLPHMGWNDVAAADDPLFEGLVDPRFYFLHSYHAQPADTSSAIAHADYGGRFVCGVRRGSAAGVQFHPEKSHHWGERVLLNFARA